MTQSEYADFNKLSPSGKRAYKRAQEDHPGWSHNQCLAKAQIEEQTDKCIGEGKDVQRPDVMKEIFEKAKEWLSKINISKSVIECFDRGIASLNQMIRNGVEFIRGTFDFLFGW